MKKKTYERPRATRVAIDGEPLMAGSAVTGDGIYTGGSHEEGDAAGAAAKGHSFNIWGDED